MSFPMSLQFFTDRVEKVVKTIKFNLLIAEFSLRLLFIPEHGPV